MSCAHSLDHVLHQVRFAFHRVEVEFADDLLEARAAQDLLINEGQTVPSSRTTHQ